MSRFTSLLLVIISFSAFGQKKTTSPSDQPLPSIVVGITVDQMRNDYIDRFWNDYCDGGFKRLVRNGSYARNMQYNYMPTYTGPGHAAIFTGTTPAHNGIVANDWFERKYNRMTYCSADSIVNGVGTSAAAGKMSPHYLKSSTIGDELKIFTAGKSKVIGISLKDRGAILPAGRTANAAYWFVGGEEGVWASSSWYMRELPKWVQDFNTNGKAKAYASSTWNLLLPEENYTESMEDNNAYEMPFKPLLRPVFPYNIDTLKKHNGGYEILKGVPMGNSLTLDFALAAIDGEQLGKNNTTDMLCLSFSSTDYVGHQFGIHSKELQDIYIRLDRELERLLNELDKRFGKDNYLIFLSADHGGAPTPSLMQKSNASAGYWSSDNFEEQAELFMNSKYGQGNWILNESNLNLFINRTLIREKNMKLDDMQRTLSKWAEEQEYVTKAFASCDLTEENYTSELGQKVQLGFLPALSGDVIYVLEPGFMEYTRQGTTHGSPYSYDSQVPFILYGKYVPASTNYAAHSITDIAPTVCSYLRIGFPNACTGNPIISFLRPTKK